MPRNERLAAALGGAIKRKFIRIKDEDLIAAAITQEFAMGSLPAGSIVVGFDIDVIEAFVGLTTVVVDVGDDGGDEYVDGLDLEAEARTSSLVAIAASDGNGIEVTALVVATVDDVVDATAGEVEIAVLYVEAGEVKTK